MSTAQEFEDELNKGLTDLSDKIATERDKGTHPNALQKTMDRFLIDWSGKLTEERETQLSDSRRSIEAAHAEVGPGATVEQERDRARLVNADIENAEPTIKDMMSQFRDGMIAGVQNIAKGHKPERVMVVSKEMENRPPDDPPRNGGGGAGELTPERVTELKAAIARQRAKESNPERDPGDSG